MTLCTRYNCKKTTDSSVVFIPNYFSSYLHVSHILFVLLLPTTNGLHVHVDLEVLDVYMAHNQSKQNHARVEGYMEFPSCGYNSHIGARPVGKRIIFNELLTRTREACISLYHWNFSTCTRALIFTLACNPAI